MRTGILGAFLICGLAYSVRVAALETDQCTVPKAPLFDAGKLLGMKISIMLENIGYRMGQLESAFPLKDPSEILYDAIGKGLPTTEIEKWLDGQRAPEGEIRFRQELWQSIYGLVISPVPASFVYIAPTINLNNIYMGADKIGHFFQQGYEYLRIFRQERAKGVSVEEAEKVAVEKGVYQERTYYGLAISGVYSNADLAANFAGLKFYRNLTEAITIGGQVFPPILVRDGKGWKLREDFAREKILEPFLSDHLNESFNPSYFRFSRSFIRAQLRLRCESWRKFYGEKAKKVRVAAESTFVTWQGQDYGFWMDPAQEASFATECPPAEF